MQSSSLLGDTQLPCIALPVQAIIVASLWKDISPPTLFEKVNRCVTYRKNPWILLDSVAPQGATLSKNTAFFTAFYRVSDIIKNVRITFEISDTRLLDALCDAKTEEKMMSCTSARVALEKISRLS